MDKLIFEKTAKKIILNNEDAIAYEINENENIGFIDYEDKSVVYHFDNSIASLTRRILVDERIKADINIQKLAEFLNKYIDDDSLSVVEHIAIIWENENIESNIRKELDEEYCDEYAWYCAEDELGLYWVERQVVIINASNIMKCLVEDYNKDETIARKEFLYEDFNENFIDTLCHELRHAIYESNDVAMQSGKYKEEDGEEKCVEAFGVMQGSYLISTDEWCKAVSGLYKNIENLVNDFQTEKEIKNIFEDR